jgi:hypothetical protein
MDFGGLVTEPLRGNEKSLHIYTSVHGDLEIKLAPSIVNARHSYALSCMAWSQLHPVCCDKIELTGDEVCLL